MAGRLPQRPATGSISSTMTWSLVPERERVQSSWVGGARSDMRMLIRGGALLGASLTMLGGARPVLAHPHVTALPSTRGESLAHDAFLPPGVASLGSPPRPNSTLGPYLDVDPDAMLPASLDPDALVPPGLEGPTLGHRSSPPTPTGQDAFLPPGLWSVQAPWTHWLARFVQVWISRLSERLEDPPVHRVSSSDALIPQGIEPADLGTPSFRAPVLPNVSDPDALLPPSLDPNVFVPPELDARAPTGFRSGPARPELDRLLPPSFHD